LYFAKYKTMGTRTHYIYNLKLLKLQVHTIEL
jgi:hypothetical protein